MIVSDPEDLFYSYNASHHFCMYVLSAEWSAARSGGDSPQLDGGRRLVAAAGSGAQEWRHRRLPAAPSPAGLQLPLQRHCQRYHHTGNKHTNTERYRFSGNDTIVDEMLTSRTFLRKAMSLRTNESEFHPLASNQLAFPVGYSCHITHYLHCLELGMLINKIMSVVVRFSMHK